MSLRSAKARERKHSMKIAVTGANGMLGQYAVAELLNAGYSVRPIDQVRPTQRPDDFRKADVRDLGQVCGALHGCDAVLHLAAIATLTAYSYDDVFANNVLGTFNVLEAAALLDIKRV